MAPSAPSALSGVGRIPLRKRDGRVVAWTTVDLEDFAALSAVRWYVSGGYVVRSVYPDGTRVPRQERMHRVIAGLLFGDRRCVDHIDHDTLNNRRSNLRVGTHAQNHQNRRSSGDRGTSSRFRGVSWADRVQGRPWHAYGQVDGRFTHIGYFAGEQEAAEAATAWRRENMPYATD